jgi:cysteinylglycine-S-conjugate dipeptidase
MSELPLSDQAIVRLADRVAARHPDDVALLERLERIPSVSGPDPDSQALARSAQAVADELDAARLDWVRIVDGAHGTPSVIGERRGPVGAPAVLLYAHHDVQPAGEESAWTTAPFQPTLRDGRLYGRGAADDKAGIVVHSAAVRALGSELPVTVRVLIDGAEEVGSPQLGDLLEAHAQHLTADVVIVADLVNAAPGAGCAG